MKIVLVGLVVGWGLLIYGIRRWPHRRRRPPPAQYVKLTEKRQAEFLDEERH